MKDSPTIFFLLLIPLVFCFGGCCDKDESDHAEVDFELLAACLFFELGSNIDEVKQSLEEKEIQFHELDALVEFNENERNDLTQEERSKVEKKMIILYGKSGESVSFHFNLTGTLMKVMYILKENDEFD